MQLPGLLERRRTEIVERWAELALSIYPEGSDSFIGREKDRFRNPVGHTTVESLRVIFDRIRAGRPVAEIEEPLDAIVRIRAIQELSPTQALGFVFLLKRAIQEELEESLADLSVQGELTQLHSRIDQVALEAFERFVSCREAIFDLRTREAKRQTWALLKRLEKSPGEGRSDPASGATEHQPKGGTGA